MKFGYISSLSIASDFRRLHLGSELLGMFERRLVERKIVLISLHASTTNRTAISMYARSGFKICGKLVDFYGENQHGYEMTKKLPSTHKKSSRYKTDRCVIFRACFVFLGLLFYVFKSYFYKWSMFKQLWKERWSVL